MFSAMHDSLVAVCSHNPILIMLHDTLELSLHPPFLTYCPGAIHATISPMMPWSCPCDHLPYHDALELSLQPSPLS